MGDNNRANNEMNEMSATNRCNQDHANLVDKGHTTCWTCGVSLRRSCPQITTAAKAKAQELHEAKLLKYLEEL